MGKGKTKLLRYDLSGNWNPSSVATAGQRGTLFRYVPDVGSPAMYMKMDDGLSTDWNPITPDAPSGTTVVAAASTANVTVASAPASIDGVALTADDEVLLKDQTDPAENGVYTFSAAASPLVRSDGWDTAANFTPGKQVFVDDGTINADTMWENADSVTTLGTDPIEFIGPITVGANRDLSNLTSPTAINEDLIFDTGGAATLKTKNSAGVTQGLNITTGNSTGNETGAISISPGLSNAADNGGIVMFTPDVVTQDYPSGSIEIFTGGVVGPTAGTGSIRIYTQGTAGGGDTGDVIISTGVPSGGAQGIIQLDADTQMGGALDINGNFINNVGHLKSGARNFDMNADAGFNVAITVSGIGKIQLVDTSIGTIGHVWTSTDVNGSGHWAAPTTGANTALSNLASVAANVPISPGVTNTIALGDATHIWSNVWATSVTSVSGGQAVNVTGMTLVTGTGATSLNWNTRVLIAGDSANALNWNNRTLNASDNTTSLNWATPATIVVSAAIQTAVTGANNLGNNGAAFARTWLTDGIFLDGLTNSPVLDVGLRRLTTGNNTNIVLDIINRRLHDAANGQALDWASGQIIVANGISFSNAQVRGVATITTGNSTVNVVSAAVSATSLVFAVIKTNDATAILKNVIPGAGSFDINTTAAVTGNTNIAWVVFQSV